MPVVHVESEDVKNILPDRPRLAKYIEGCRLMAKDDTAAVP
jgi:hypothetical protein